MPRHRPLISTQISRASAGLLLVGGLALLFAADDILPRLIPAFPAAGAWLGQLLAAAWLAVAMLNWLSQSLLLGGIYGRPVVLTNAVLYFVGAMVLLKIVTRSNGPAAVGLLVVPFVFFSAVYAWLLFRGPLERDFEMHRRSQQGQR
jgi:hypothetical protein